MSTQWNPVIKPGQIVVPNSSAASLFGPFDLYTLSGAEVSRIEAVSFTYRQRPLATNVQFRLELTDPSDNVLYQCISPVFNYD